MFTGLIQNTTTVQALERREGGYDFAVTKPSSWNDLKIGESIAVDGVCLTVTLQENEILQFFMGMETLKKTCLMSAKPGHLVNLERSLALSDRLGGHFVTGHVDGTALVTLTQKEGECLHLQLAVPHDLMKWIMPKGSLAVNGVSLTINELDRKSGKVSFLLIPETLARTNLSAVGIGQLVNVECDPLVKTVVESLRMEKWTTSLM